MNKEHFAEKLIEIFPEKYDVLHEHYHDYNELLGHVFFSEAINIELFDLLLLNRNNETIKKYCDFIEEMWLMGDETVRNIVDVTILERLSDGNKVWVNFGNYISNEFKDYITMIYLIRI